MPGVTVDQLLGAATNSFGAVPTPSLPVTHAVPAGRVVLVTLGVTGGAFTTADATVTDARGNVYTKLGATTDPATDSGTFWSGTYASKIETPLQVGDAITATVALGASPAANWGLVATSLTGLSTRAYAQNGHGNIGLATWTAAQTQVASSAPIKANDLTVGVSVVSSVSASTLPSAGWTQIQSADITNMRLLVAIKIPTVDGVQTFTPSNTGNQGRQAEFIAGVVAARGGGLTFWM